MLQVWTEICHQIFGVWEMQTMWNFHKNVWCVWREVCFRQKLFTNGLNMGLLLWARVKKIVYGVKTHWLSGKEKVPGIVVSKEGHAVTIFWDMKEPITIDFLENDASINSACYCQLFWQNSPYLLNSPCISIIVKSLSFRWSNGMI